VWCAPLARPLHDQNHTMKGGEAQAKCALDAAD
jgi:hypothetical protein